MISMVSISKKIPSFKSPFWVNFFAKIKSQKKILIVMSILHLLGLPLLWSSYIYNEVSDKYSSYGFVPLSMCCLIGALLCGFIIAITTFDYLYKKSNVDMVYSLPLTNSQHFLSDYFAGLSVYTVPYLLSVMLTFIIDGLCKIVFTDWKILNTLDGLSGMLGKLSLAGFILMIMFYTLTVLITCCCGSMFEAISYNVIANGLIPGVIAIFILIFFNDLYGIDTDNYLFEYISYNSPIGSLIGLFNIQCLSDSEESISPLIRWYVLNFAFDIIYFFLAMFLYSKRKAEDVSKPFVFKAFYYLVITTITFIIVASAIQFDDMDNTIPMIVFSAIVYFILEIISNRGFKNFGYSIARYFATLFAVIIFTLIVGATNGFGVENRVPVAESIRSVTINYNGLYQNDGSYSNTYETYDEVTFNDRETIKLVTEFHKDAVQNRFVSYARTGAYYNEYSESGEPQSVYLDDDYPTYSQDFNYIDYNKYVKITYTTYLGRNISRNYKVSFEQYMMLKDLSVHKNYIKYSADNFKENLLERYTSTELNGYYTNVELTSLKSRKYFISVSSKMDINSKKYENLTYDEILLLADAYRKDLENRTLDDIMQPEDTYCLINGYAIFSSYNNTIDFLTTHKYLPPSIEAELSAYNSYDYNNEIILYSPDEISCVGGHYTTAAAFKTMGYGVNLYSTDKQLLELLKVAQPYYITTDKCYVLYFNNQLYVVPSKYTNIAEECYGIDRSKISASYDSNMYNNLKAIWNNYYVNENYPDFTLFLNELVKGQLDMSVVTRTSDDYEILERYYNIYWEIYYGENIQVRWQEEFMNEYPTYDEYIWSIINDILNSN